MTDNDYGLDIPMVIPAPVRVEPNGIFAALLEAQRHADAITKSGRNTSQGWAFVTVEEVTRVAREALNRAGLVAYLRVLTPYDPHMIDAYLALVHPASGQEALFAVPWPVERPGPQARRAAYAYARKQALLELLALSESDPETTATPEPVNKPAKRIRVPLTHKEATEIQQGARRLQSGQKDSAGVAPTAMGDGSSETGAEGINAPTVPAEPSKRSKRVEAALTRATPAPGMVTRPQVIAIHSALTMLERIKGKRLDDTARHAVIADAAGYSGELASTYDLSHEEARRAIESLKVQARAAEIDASDG